MANELVAMIAKEYSSAKWLDIKEIEYVVQQPLEEAFRFGLPIFYQQDGWQDVSQALVTCGKLYISGHFKITELTSSLIEQTDQNGFITHNKRLFNITCALLADGYTQFRLTSEIQDNIYEPLQDIQELNTLTPCIEFCKEVYWDSFDNPLAPPINHLQTIHSPQLAIVCTEQALKHYCEQFFIKKHDERLENIKNSRLLNESPKDVFTAPHYSQTTNHPTNAPHKKSAPRNENALAPQGRNALTRTARALAKCLVPELSDVPTNEQLNMLIKLMEDEHNDIPCDIKTLKRHLTNPN